MKHKASIAGAFALVLATTVTSFAAQSNDAIGISETKVGQIPALATAEQHASGKATHADFRRNRKWERYEVEVVTGIKTLDVRSGESSDVIVVEAEAHADRNGDSNGDGGSTQVRESDQRK
jgi:hypothetical protein